TFETGCELDVDPDVAVGLLGHLRGDVPLAARLRCSNDRAGGARVAANVERAIGHLDHGPVRPATGGEDDGGHPPLDIAEVDLVPGVAATLLRTVDNRAGKPV